MKKEQVLAKLRSCGLVAVVRAKDADDAMRIAEACIEGGCAGIELHHPRRQRHHRKDGQRV